MLRKIWQWLKGLFQGWFGSKEARGNVSTPPETLTPKPLEDTDYEYLFRQLLEGVSHGWQQARILKFFEGLQGRTTNAEWVAWLDRFGEKVLASQAANYELARRMVRLGEMTQSIPAVREIGEAAYAIGAEVLTREHTGIVWEYEGPDGNPRIISP